MVRLHNAIAGEAKLAQVSSVPLLYIEHTPSDDLTTDIYCDES